MGSPAVRYLASAALIAGLAAIAWVVLRGDDPAGTLTDTVSAADNGNAAAADGAAADDDGEGPAEAVAGAELTAPAPADLPPPEMLGEADTLTGLDGWLNTDAASLEEIRAANTVTVVQFWTFGCRNCKNTLDALSRLYADFGGRGVEIVGVHSPEFSYEADVDNIIEAASDLGVTWPIALDTRKRNFHRWQEGPTGYWPRVYVIDADNQIRFDRRGDGAATYQELYETVERLLADA